MKSIVLSFVVFCVFLTSLLSQEVELKIGAGLNSQGVIDKGYSPLRYDGLGYDTHLGLSYEKKNREVIWMAGIGQARLYSDFSRSMKTTAISLINLTFYNQKNESQKHKWGWSNNNTFHTRQIDDFLNYNGRTDYFTAFGPAWKYDHFFKIYKQSFRFETMAHIQLFGFYMPSSYVSSMPGGFGYENKSFLPALWSSSYLFLPGSAYNVGLYPSMKWQFSENNHLSLLYRYEYTYFRQIHTSERSVGTWWLSLVVKLF